MIIELRFEFSRPIALLHHDEAYALVLEAAQQRVLEHLRQAAATITNPTREDVGSVRFAITSKRA